MHGPYFCSLVASQPCHRYAVQALATLRHLDVSHLHWLTMQAPPQPSLGPAMALKHCANLRELVLAGAYHWVDDAVLKVSDGLLGREIYVKSYLKLQTYLELKTYWKRNYATTRPKHQPITFAT